MCCNDTLSVSNSLYMSGTFFFGMQYLDHFCIIRNPNCFLLSRKEWPLYPGQLFCYVNTWVIYVSQHDQSWIQHTALVSIDFSFDSVKCCSFLPHLIHTEIRAKDDSLGRAATIRTGPERALKCQQQFNQTRPVCFQKCSMIEMQVKVA